MINIWHYLIIQAPKNGQFRIERVPSFNGHLVFWQTGIYMPNTGMITIKIIKPLNIGWSHIWLNWVFPLCIYSKTRPWPTQKRLTQRVLQSQSSSRQKVVVFYGFLSPPSTIPYSPIYHPISFEFCIPSDQKSHAKWGFEQHSGLPFQDVHPGGCDLGTFGSACASHHGSHHIKPAGFFGLMVSVMVYTGLQLKAQKITEEFSRICSPKTSSVSSQNMSFWAWACSKWENILKQSSYLASGSSGHHHIQFQLLWGIGCFGCWAAYCTRSVSMLETSVMKHLNPSPVQSVW